MKKLFRIVIYFTGLLVIYQAIRFKLNPFLFAVGAICVIVFAFDYFNYKSK
jgi:hypothetical protein